MGIQGYLRPFIFAATFSACTSLPKRTVQTGVNETLLANSVPVEESRLKEFKKADDSPFSELEIKGALDKKEVIRKIKSARRSFDRCYRDAFGVAELIERRSANQLVERNYNMRVRKEAKIHADGLRDSPTFNAPYHGEGPTTEGDVTLHFGILPDGTVESSRVSLSDLRSMGFHECLQKVVSQFQFSPQKDPTQVRHLLLRFSHEYGLVLSKAKE